ncbi:DoxX family protein [Rhodococcus sp. NPDC060176]|uniref:DoxX family protein n=1 Tax=Rhodococcus sp. NPDC060176 TaxID=3347062 RepID=UPI0036657B55
MSKKLRDTWILLARSTLGIMFSTSGWGKIANPEKFNTDFQNWGVPLSDISAPATAWAELVLGTLLTVGVLTRIAAIGLTATMIGAITYATFPSILNTTSTAFGFMSSFFYSSEWLLTLILTTIIYTGAGQISIDRALRGETPLND